MQAYADDIILLALTASGLQSLLENAGSLLADSDLVFLSTRKTKAMAFSVFNDPIEVGS